ncbi:MAG: rhodanese-like domain-containing protein [Flavobacterium lindanitolerans]|jgi:rhodanese-related sulfurtransferase|nr:MULTISPECIES: rhodanese-like domain-containing protein [Flavobacterium]KQS45633.1 rhodanese [Flavobacterium sp. Leaf359]MDQ7960474.1 rhodanese-like domain-containing protein [Flavobacterium lindanitolerans]OJX55167.1 MAG: rhodanese [Flavobacterium sp. 38-13]
MMNITQEQWWSQAQEDENAVILDVRTEDECNRGMIPGAKNIDIYKGQGFIYEVEELDKTKNYYVYCQAGMRSAKACSVMEQLGFATTYNLVGGMSEWDGPVVLPE